MAPIFLLNKLTSKKGPCQWRKYGPVGPAAAGAPGPVKTGPKGAHFQVIYSYGNWGPIFVILRGPKFELKPLVLTQKMRPKPCARGCLPCPFTTPLHGNTVQVSNGDTRQNISIPKWYKWPLFSS